MFGAGIARGGFVTAGGRLTRTEFGSLGATFTVGPRGGFRMTGLRATTGLEAGLLAKTPGLIPAETLKRGGPGGVLRFGRAATLGAELALCAKAWTVAFAPRFGIPTGARPDVTVGL